MNIESKAEKPSKSARKREIAALQELAEQMVALSDSELQRLGVDESLRLEIQQVRSIRPSGARNRQLKHCVKYLDSQDLSAVRAYLADQHSQRIAANRQLHEIERWRPEAGRAGHRHTGNTCDACAGTRSGKTSRAGRQAPHASFFGICATYWSGQTKKN